MALRDFMAKNSIHAAVIVMALYACCVSMSVAQSVDGPEDAKGGASIYDRFYLTSLEWPPYTGANLPGGGTSTTRLRALLKSRGIALEVDFRPWQRAVREGTRDSRYSGYFPEYAGPNLKCDLSAAYDNSRVGFAVNSKGQAFGWQSIADLAGYEIGIVDGYINDGGPFDAAVREEALLIQKTQDDLRNLRKLAAGRLNAIVIDQQVLAYLIDRHLPAYKTQIEMHDTLLKHHGLHVCTARTARGRAFRALLDTVIEQPLAPSGGALQ